MCVAEEPFQSDDEHKSTIDHESEHVGNLALQYAVSTIHGHKSQFLPLSSFKSETYGSNLLLGISREMCLVMDST